MAKPVCQVKACGMSLNRKKPGLGYTFSPKRLLEAKNRNELPGSSKRKLLAWLASVND